jgi:hypothetical protein
MAVITPLPTPPSTSSPGNFDSRADAFLGALPVFVTETNIVAQEAADDAAAAAASAQAAAVSAATSGVILWVSGTTYAINDTRISPSDWQAYRRKTAGAGTTDPSADTTNWSPLIRITQTRIAMPANAIDLSTGAGFFTKTISGNTTFTISGQPATGIGVSFILDLTNGGSATITWFPNVRWTGGAAPTFTAAGRDVIGFMTHDNGATWTGMLLAKGAA